MFTHLPRRCTIRIYTVSGVLVDAIEVDNFSESDGNAYWDLLTNEGLEIAAGMYLYHVKSPLTSYEKMENLQLLNRLIIILLLSICYTDSINKNSFNSF